MGREIEPTKDNIDILEQVLAAFRRDLGMLVKMTKKYPVEIEFASYRFVFTKKADIEELISALDDKVSDFRRAA
jgi:hypothetical protein